MIHDLAAEYLALTIARRRPDLDAEHIAQLTGLPVTEAARLTRVRDLGEIQRRRIHLAAYTLRGPQ